MPPYKILKDTYDNWDSFLDACYQEYLSFFQSNPKLFGKPLRRSLSIDPQTNREKDFWGICNGHDPNKQYNDMERYETISYLRYVVCTCTQGRPDRSAEIIWWKTVRNRKQRLMLLCETLSYLVVCQINGESDNPSSYQFITAYPVTGKRSFETKIKEFEAFWS